MNHVTRHYLIPTTRLHVDSGPSAPVTDYHLQHRQPMFTAVVYRYVVVYLVVIVVYLTECNICHFKFLVVEHSLQVTVKHFQSTTQRALDTWI